MAEANLNPASLWWHLETGSVFPSIPLCQFIAVFGCPCIHPSIIPLSKFMSMFSPGCRCRVSKPFLSLLQSFLLPSCLAPSSMWRSQSGELLPCVRLPRVGQVFFHHSSNQGGRPGSSWLRHRHVKSLPFLPCLLAKARLDLKIPTRSWERRHYTMPPSAPILFLLTFGLF